MSRFNKKKSQATLTVNRQGGTAYKRSPEYRLVSMLLTNFVTDQFYRKTNQSLSEMTALLDQVDPQFAAKAAVFTRNEFGMRSISHALAAGLAAKAAGTSWGRNFYDRIVRRPDDMLEITAAYLNAEGSGKHLTNAMKKGFAAAFDRFDGYQLAKYRGEGKAVKLIDVVNLVRPVPTKRNAAALQQLVAGTLRNRDTWESKLSAAGQTKDAVEKQSAKAEAWADLLATNKLGYFALVRNLRNILEQAPECISLVEDQLADPRRIRKSLVLPFRLLSAYKEVLALQEPKVDATTSHSPFNALRQLFAKENGEGAVKRPKFSLVRRRVLAALETAINISCGNLPDLRNSLVAIDNSGSMGSPVGGSNKIRCNELGALFGFALAKRSNADLMEFGTTARFLDYQLSDSTLSFASKFAQGNQVGHGTNFQAIFKTAGRRTYDRIIILSDMQSGLHQRNGQAWLSDYRKLSGADPFVYTLDLRGYGSAQFPVNEKLFEVAGFSEKVFDLMKLAEQNPQVLLEKIAAVAL